MNLITRVRSINSQEPVEDPALEAQRDGRVLNVEQQTDVWEEPQVCMAQVQFCDLHAEQRGRHNESDHDQHLGPAGQNLQQNSLCDGVLEPALGPLHVRHADVTELLFHKPLSLKLYWEDAKRTHTHTHTFTWLSLSFHRLPFISTP